MTDLPTRQRVGNTHLAHGARGVEVLALALALALGRANRHTQHVVHPVAPLLRPVRTIRTLPFSTTHGRVYPPAQATTQDVRVAFDCALNERRVGTRGDLYMCLFSFTEGPRQNRWAKLRLAPANHAVPVECGRQYHQR